MRMGLLTAGIALAGLPGAAALGQNALGTGNALDANFGQYRSNYRKPVEDYKARNLVVTRNVAAGRGFQGTVGYQAQNDFWAEPGEGLGTNDLYVERANAALSDPSLLEAGRTFERFRFGQYLGAVPYRRSGYAASLSTIQEQQYVPAQLNDDRLMLDRISLSSTSQMVYESASDSRVIGMLQDEERTYVATASSLVGMQLTPLEMQGQIVGLTGYDLARTMQDLSEELPVSQIGAIFEARYENLKVKIEGDSGLVAAAQVDPEGLKESTIVLPAEYRRVMEGVAQRAAASLQAEDDQLVLSALDRQLDELRTQLGAEPLVPDKAAAPEAEADEAAEDEIDVTAIPRLEDIAVPLRHGQRLERLSTEDQTRFNELMKSAEEKLRSGEYFWAERRYSRALRFTPDHPLATAGMINAQIGAGLYVPAALRLHHLFVNQPEMIDVQFSPNLLPDRVRLNVITRTVRGLIADEERDRGLLGFLLAYIGHQTSDRSLVEEGLAVMSENIPDDPLYPLLRSIWLSEEEKN